MEEGVEKGFSRGKRPEKYEKQGKRGHPLHEKGKAKHSVQQPDGTRGGLNSKTSGKEKSLPYADPPSEKDHDRGGRRHDAEPTELDKDKNNPL